MIDAVKGGLDKRFYIKHGPDLVACFRKHIFMDAKDVYGKKFKSYSKEYGQAKKTGGMKRQASEFKNSNAPVLTSDLLRDWTMRSIGSSGFKFGTLAHGGKVESLAKLGRVISSKDKPIPDGCGRKFMLSADRWVRKSLKNITKGKKNIKINI